LVLLDQTKIPYEIKSWSTNNWLDASLRGIKGMIVRGSQAIGVAGAYTVLLAANDISEQNIEEAKKILFDRANKIKESRPTAVNLSWAVDRILKIIRADYLDNLDALKSKVLEVANQIFLEDLILNYYLRLNGLKFIENEDVILTHCNAGSLATVYGGSALSILTEAYVNGKNIMVVAKETRPRSQGFKITLWELNKVGIPTVAITDNMISKSIAKFKINKVIVGADRITKDGFATNKIGTIDIARISQLENIPFYVAASHSTLDLKNSGFEIPIEERDKDEIRKFYQYEAAYLFNKELLSKSAYKKWPIDEMLTESDKPKSGQIKLYNPAFDTTPAELISKLILDIGIFNPADIKNLTWDKIYTQIRDLKSRFKI
jgi:methylthioribose-1-phosphate isomerase